jgi:hypothetical protein
VEAPETGNCARRHVDLDVNTSIRLRIPSRWSAIGDFMSAAPETNRDVVLAALRSILDGARRPLTIIIQDGATAVASFNLPPATPSRETNPPPQKEDGERDLRADILTILRAAGQRLTTAQVLSEIARRRWNHGERTVKGRLAEMVKDGWIDNDPEADPPGYAALEV